MTALLLATLVRFTLPALNCDGSTMTDLDSLWVRYQPSGSVVRVAVSESVRGHEGSPWSAWVAAPPDTLTAVWADLSDVAGNRSCAGTVLWLGATAGVPGGSPIDTTLYDVQGRRAAGKVPGVYFGRRKRVVR